MAKAKLRHRSLIHAPWASSPRPGDSVLDGLVKKRPDIPPGVLTRVRRYQRALEAAERQRDKP